MSFYTPLVLSSILIARVCWLLVMQRALELQWNLPFALRFPAPPARRPGSESTRALLGAAAGRARPWLYRLAGRPCVAYALS